MFYFFAYFRFKFFASLHFSNFRFETKQSEAEFKYIFSLFFALNFLLRFDLVIFASKGNKAKRNSSLFFRFFSLFFTFFYFFSRFSLFFAFFASNFSLRFDLVIFASKRSEIQVYFSLFFVFFTFFPLFFAFFRIFFAFFSFFSLYIFRFASI